MAGLAKPTRRLFGLDFASRVNRVGVHGISDTIIDPCSSQLCGFFSYWTVNSSENS